MDSFLKLAAALAALGLCAPATAQSFTRAPGWHIAPQAGTYTEGGIGAPSVVFRKKYGDFVMFFEAKVAAADADCMVGYWGISTATSPDGLNWTVAATQKLPNIDGSFFECVAAHPSAVLDDNGEDIHLWFKGEQGTQACVDGDKPWGCRQYTGVGYAKFDKNLNMTTSSAEPVLDESATFGFPAVVRVDDGWKMMLARYPAFYLATSDQPDSGWTFANGGAPVMSPGVTSWAQDELFNPALVCDNEAQFAYKVYLGGRNFGNSWPNIEFGGWGDAISQEAVSWFINGAPHFNWAGNDAWRHWDGVRVGDEMLIWFSEKEGGKNHIGFGYTSATWDEHDIQSRLCPEAEGWGLVPGDSEYTDAIEWYRNLVTDWDNDASACANDIINDANGGVHDIITQELHFEFIKGHPDHMGPDGFDAILPLLNQIESSCGDDTEILREQLAALSIHGLKLYVGRVEDISGPTNSDVLAAKAALVASEDYALLGLWNSAMTESSAAMDALAAAEPPWAGNWCDGNEVDVYHTYLCDAQALIEDIDALGNSDLDDATDEIKAGLENLASAAGVKDVIKNKDRDKWRHAAKVLAEEGATAQLQELATISKGLTTRFVRDAEISDHGSDIAGAEADLASGDAFYAAGDWEDAIRLYAEAAKKARG